VIDIRPIVEKDLEQAKILIPAGCAELLGHSAMSLSKTRNCGAHRIETRLVAEPVYIKKGANVRPLMAFGWLDGYMRK